MSELELRDVCRLFDVAERRYARDAHREILSIVASLGGDARKFQRERARSARAIVSELYSPPRVAELIRQMPRYGLSPGFTLDLATTCDDGIPWDFNRKCMQDKAEALIEKQRPMFFDHESHVHGFFGWAAHQ